MKKRTLNPVFNESFVFDLPASQYTGLEGVELEFLVLDWDRLTKNEVIGRLELGRLDGQEKATKQWQDIQVRITHKKGCWIILLLQAQPRRQIAEWHHLV